MGKDVEGCCASCKLFGDETQAPAIAVAPPLKALRDTVKIVVYRGDTQIAEVLPTSDRVMVGRVQGNDVVLPSGTISKRQCMFAFTDEAVVLVDMKSNCGTLINGRKISSPTQLPEGAQIYMGDFRLRVVPR